ncbi:MarR family winged helix-turn-helix transcriptional regulator [Segetibacter koreensis]|uniref:MarR family winged helix-turn-helix transcriptional regulator n=1 Tax=Segetibacter koreensis TaxID=398037 RepID=UPI0004772994|nr:MarR family transcriptional regulator [Segetibacter koreensis]
MKIEDALKMTRFSSQKHKAGLNILYTAWWLKTMVSKELKAVGLTHEQYNVLRILKGKHPEAMCVKDIGNRMIEPSSNVPRIVDRLVAKNYVERSTSVIDKRETVITLTNVGLDALQTATNKVDNLFTNSLHLLEDDAIKLNTMLENIRGSE